MGKQRRRSALHAVTVKLISVFVFATQIVQSLFFQNPKFQASSHLLWLYTAWFVSDLVGNPEDRFSYDAAHLFVGNKGKTNLGNSESIKILRIIIAK